MRNVLSLSLLVLSLLVLSLVVPGSASAAAFGEKEKATVNHPDSGDARLGGSSGQGKPLPPDSTRGVAPPDERTGNYLPGSEGVQRYNQQEPNKGVVPPLGGTPEAPGKPGGPAGTPDQAKPQSQDKAPQTKP